MKQSWTVSAWAWFDSRANYRDGLVVGMTLTFTMELEAPPPIQQPTIHRRRQELLNPSFTLTPNSKRLYPGRKALLLSTINVLLT